VLADPTLVATLDQEDRDRLQDWVNQDLAMNGILAGASVYGWHGKYNLKSRMQFYDEDYDTLYQENEDYRSQNWGPGTSTWVWGTTTTDTSSKNWSASAGFLRSATQYQDAIIINHPDYGTFKDSYEEAEASKRVSCGFNINSEDLNDDHKNKPSGSVSGSGSYWQNPLPNSKIYSVSSKVSGSLNTDLLPKNSNHHDLTVNSYGLFSASQNTAPSDPEQMTKESLYFESGGSARLKFNSRWGMNANFSGDYSDWISNYSLGTDVSGDFYVYGQYSPPDKDLETDYAEQNNPFISSIKLGLGGNLADSHMQVSGIDATIDTTTQQLYAKFSTSTNEKNDFSFYVGAKPRWNWESGTENSAYPSLSSWLGAEYTPGFHAFSFQINHFWLSNQDMRYVHTDPTQSYYYPEGYYDFSGQQFELVLSASIMPISRLEVDLSTEASQYWATGDMSPSDDTTFSGSASINWLISRHKPYLACGVSGDYEFSRFLSNEEPTTDMKQQDWSVSFDLSTDYLRLKG